ncbi:MAG: hypothetical protein ACF8R7_16560 [Phycisphaerales bacterium JB039]
MKLRCALVTIAMLGLAGAALAQGPGRGAADGPRRAGQPEQPEQQTDAERRAARRAWLVRRLEESRQEQARLQQMIEQIDAGEPLPEFPRRGRGGGRFDDERGQGERGPGPGPAEPDPQERLRLVLQFTREHFPEFASKLESERESNPEGVSRIAARFWPRIAELIELEDSDPALFAIEVDRLRNGEEIMSTVWKARRDPPTDEAAREALGAELRRLATRQFELRLAATTRRLESLRASVRETEQELAQHETNREASIEEQVERLLRMIERPDRWRGDRGDDRGEDAGRDGRQRDDGRGDNLP